MLALDDLCRNKPNITYLLTWWPVASFTKEEEATDTRSCLYDTSVILNSWPSYAIFHQWSWLSLLQVMECHLLEPSHYLDQWELIIAIYQKWRPFCSGLNVVNLTNTCQTSYTTRYSPSITDLCIHHSDHFKEPFICWYVLSSLLSISFHDFCKFRLDSRQSWCDRSLHNQYSPQWFSCQVSSLQICSMVEPQICWNMPWILSTNTIAFNAWFFNGIPVIWHASLLLCDTNIVTFLCEWDFALSGKKHLIAHLFCLVFVFSIKIMSVQKFSLWRWDNLLA